MSKALQSKAFVSISFPNVFLRMDGSGVKSASDKGAGTVNCQLGVGPWEKFHKRAQSDGSVAFESAAFPGVYLRMDAQSIGEFGSAPGSRHGELPIRRWTMGEISIA